MQKDTRNILIFVVLLGLLFAGIWFWSSKSSKTVENKEATFITSDILFFYGKECPHCVETEEFLIENKIAEKIKYDSLEVWYNKQNAALLQEKALECGLEKDEIGVPFLYSKGQCLMGSPDIEKFFQDQISEK